MSLSMVFSEKVVMILYNCIPIIPFLFLMFSEIIGGAIQYLYVGTSTLLRSVMYYKHFFTAFVVLHILNRLLSRRSGVRLEKKLTACVLDDDLECVVTYFWRQAGEESDRVTHVSWTMNRSVW